MSENITHADFGGHPSEQGVEDIESPESDFLRAACAAGEWTPAKWMLSRSIFSPLVNDPGGTLSHAWSFIDSYHSAEGTTPPWDLVVAKYPSLVSDYDLPLSLALKNLHEALHDDNVRRMSMVIQRAVQSGDRDALDKALHDTQTIRTAHEGNTYINHSSDPNNRFNDVLFDDEDVLEDDSVESLFSTECRALNEALGGGFYPGSLNLVGALPGVGKSMWLAQRAIEAIETGLNVCIFSLEMSAREYSKRMHNMILGCDARSLDKAERRDALNAWYSSTPGQLSFARVDSGFVTVADVAARMEVADVVIVDYAGLMTSGKGENHAESHNAAAQVANELMATAQRFNGDDGGHVACLLVAVQLSKLAVKPRGISMVGKNLRAIADSMAYSRNSHTLTTIHSEGMPAHLRMLAVEKNRNSVAVPPWYETFRPDVGDFSEVSNEAARAAIDAEDVKNYDG